MTGKKQNVWVPIYANHEHYEQYHGVPADQYLPECKKALEEFFVQHPLNTKMISTSLRNCILKNINRIDVSIEGDKLKIVSSSGSGETKTIVLQPWKFGLDVTDDGHRIWFFDQSTLNDYNLTGISKLQNFNFNKFFPWHSLSLDAQDAH